MSTPTVAKPLLPASSFDFLRWLHSFWVKKKQRYSLQVDMQYAFDALVAAIAGTQGWPATAAGVERIASKAGSIVTALRNRYKTGSVEKLVFILANKEFTPKVEEVVDAIKKKRDERKKRFKEARSVAKAAAMRTVQRTGSASQAPAAVPVAAAASDLSPNPVVPQVGDEVGVVADEPEALEEDEFSVDFDESGDELDEHAIQALLDGIYDADSSAEDAIAQFDDFVAEVLAAPAAAEFDGIYEQGGSY